MSTTGRERVLPEAGWSRFLWPVAMVWLWFVAAPAVDHVDDPFGWPYVEGYVGAVALVLAYVACFRLLLHHRAQGRRVLPRAQAWSLLAVMTLGAVMVCRGWSQDGAGGFLPVAIAAAMVLPVPEAVVFVSGVAVGLLVATLVQPTWKFDYDTPVVCVLAGVVMWGAQRLVDRNEELVRMRHENEVLLLEQERNRVARDLHDILGHSLTVIAVKAELAERLLEQGDHKAVGEVAELGRLSRETLQDVRRAVEGYREITLPGELARAKLALESAGVAVELPLTTDHVSGPLRELFAWTVREGVTNVLRHSRAGTCSVELQADRVAVRNDGVLLDRPVVEGGGLRGLRERAEALGARMVVQGGPGEPFVLEVVA